jgi:hypothetical protein
MNWSRRGEKSAVIRSAGPGYFLATVILNSLVESGPSVGCPVTLTVKSPNEASAADLSVTVAAVSPCLMIGLEDSSE